MCEIEDVNKRLGDFIEETKESQNHLEKMIIDVHNKNIEEHQEIRQSQEKLEKSIESLTSSVVDFKIESSKKFGEMIGKIGTAEGDAKSANKINGWLKWMIGLAAVAALSMLGIMTNNSIDNAKVLKADAKEKVAAYKAMIQMNAKFDAFSGKALMDTINSHWEQTKAFYAKDYKPQKQWTHSKYVKEIHPNTIRSKKNSLILQDHEKRIEKLEKSRDENI